MSKIPQSFWTYQAEPPLSHWQAVELGAINPATMTEQGWESLTPGMRREIVRSFKKKIDKEAKSE